jgi:hypothetical protein
VVLHLNASTPAIRLALIVDVPTVEFWRKQNRC